MDGILYVAIGAEHYGYALTSLESVKRYMKVATAVVTDVGGDESPFGIVIDAESGYAPEVKAEAIANSPFDRTIYLDCDTWLCGPIYELFDILDRFDIAGVMSESRHGWKTTRPVPRWFSEINSGVLAYRDSGATRDMMSDWIDCCIHRPEGVNGDMGALREALYYSDARLCTLPPEFNLYAREAQCVGASAIRVIHGKMSRDEFEKIRREVNTERKTRMYVPERLQMSKWQT